jgi:hypothetical protein
MNLVCLHPSTQHTWSQLCLSCVLSASLVTPVRFSSNRSKKAHSRHEGLGLGDDCYGLYLKCPSKCRLLKFAHEAIVKWWKL